MLLVRVESSIEKGSMSSRACGIVVSMCRSYGLSLTNAFVALGQHRSTRALYDLIMHTASTLDEATAKSCRLKFRTEFQKLCSDDNFTDYISRAVDHKSRTDCRFEIWDARMKGVLA